MSDKEGWISLHRKIQDCFIWDEKPFSWGQAWIDLLLLANHEDKRIYFAGKMTVIGRGQRITSIRILSERWGWSRHKTSDFLNLLEKENMIIQKRDNKKTLVTIVNYGDYQDVTRKKEPQKSHKGATKEPLSDTNNNENNENNISPKGDIYMGTPVKAERYIIPPTYEMVRDYCVERGNGIDPQTFIDFYQSKGWHVGKNKMKDWQASIRTWENNGRGTTKRNVTPQEFANEWLSAAKEEL